MGGRQKRLTQTRRKELTKAMTEALVAGQFRLGEGQSLDSVLDEIDDGIKNDRYPIDVDLPGLLAIWSGTPAPEAAQTAAGSEQGAPPAAETQFRSDGNILDPNAVLTQVPVGPAAVPGTVEHAQAQAAAATNGASPIAQAILGQGPPVERPEGWPVQGGHPVYSSLQQKVIQVDSEGNQLPDAPVNGQAPVTELGTLPSAIAPAEEKAPVVDVDLDAVRGWLQVAKGAQAKIDAAKDVFDQAMSQVNDFLDQQGGPDVSKKGLLDNEHVVQRTFCRRKVFNKKDLLADHPEISEEQYTEKTPYYRTELK